MGGLAELVMARSIEVDNQHSVHTLYRHLEERFPELKTRSFKVLVNNEVINSERKLADDDEVLLVPPHESM